MGRAGRQPPPGGWRHGLPCHVVSQPIWKSRVKRLSLHGRRSACASPFFVLGTVKGSWMPSFEPQKVPFRREKGRFLVCKGRPCTVQKAWLGGTGTAWRRSGMWRLLSELCFFFTFFMSPLVLGSVLGCRDGEGFLRCPTDLPTTKSSLFFGRFVDLSYLCI